MVALCFLWGMKEKSHIFNLEMYSILEVLRDRSKNSEVQKLLMESKTRLKANNLSAF